MSDAKQQEKAHVSVKKVIIGTMEMGRRADQKTSAEMCNYFVQEGFTETDTALMYAGGQTEKIIGQFGKGLTSKLTISTKVNPWQKGGMSKEHVLRQANKSLASLKASCVDILYLHAPDHNTPIEDTLEGVQQLYNEKKFQRFGLSNYAAWQVVDIYHICKTKGYVIPTVYQGMYNVMTRGVEAELFPALRRLNMSFYAYNPLAGGILTNKYKFEEADQLTEGRFAGGGWAVAYRERFWNTTNFEAIASINDALTTVYGEGKVPLAAASIRWLMHHSSMTDSYGDGLILGASGMTHLVSNTAAAKEGPLEQAVVDAMEKVWEKTKAVAVHYFR